MMGIYSACFCACTRGAGVAATKGGLAVRVGVMVIGGGGGGVAGP